MGNSTSTPEDRARQMSRSDFIDHPSLTPIEPVEKRPLPPFVPVMSMPEGHVHRVQVPDTTDTAFEHSVATLPGAPAGYLFQPNRTLEHINGKETKVRYIRHFGAPARKGKLYFLRSRTVERKEDATASEKLLSQMLDEIKAQNKAFTTMEAKQMQQLERALEEMVGVVNEHIRNGTAIDVRIQNALKGEPAELMNVIVAQWLNRVKQRLGSDQTTNWGKLKTNIMRAKPWLKTHQAEKKQADILSETLGDDDVLGASLTAHEDLSSLGRRESSAGIGDRLSTPDSDAGDPLDDTLGLTATMSGLSALTTPVAEEILDFDATILEDYLQDLTVAEPDFDKALVCEQLAKAFTTYADVFRALYNKYSVADEHSSTGQSISLVQFQIFILEVNCAIEEREAKDVYDSMCGFDWDKSPKKIMQLNLFAHALVRAASLYLENIMSQTTHSGFAVFDGKQVSSHLVELLRHCSKKLKLNLDIPVIEGIADIRVRTTTGGDGKSPGSDSGTGEGATDGGAAGGADANGDVAPPAPWELSGTFRINSLLLEDLCEEIEDQDELKALLQQLHAKVKELQKTVIEQFADAAGVETVNTGTLDQHVSREAFIAHAARVDPLIDEETADDIFSQLCGYPFEKVQKPMDLHIYAHAWVRLANLYSMFAAADGNADFVDIVAQLQLLADKLNGEES